MNITELRQGEKAVIVAVAAEHANELRKMMVFGLITGAEIEVLQEFPCYVLQIGNTQLAMDKKMAKHIEVNKKDRI